MINPNIYKRVLVVASEVKNGRQYAEYHGQKLEVNELKHGFLKAGSRYAYLKFSILADSYYLTKG